MGNCCGKSSGNFQGEGRTLGSAPAPVPSSSPPSSAPLPHNVSQARPAGISAAGQAAQERIAKMNSGQGKLGQNLADQKKQTRTDTLKELSEEERRHRDIAENSQARNWD